MTTDKQQGASNLDDEIAQIERFIQSRRFRERQEGGRPKHTGIRPRNAATIVVVQREGRDTRILMGKRHHSLKFMPGALVFPGGSVDPTDGLVPVAGELPAPTLRKIVAHMRGKAGNRSARAIAVAAIRELAEESGLIIGGAHPPVNNRPDWAAFAEKGLAPSLEGLSLLARAITPPGPPRRFDTWFFVTSGDRIAFTPESGFSPSGELEQLQWVRPRDAMNGETREITRVMLVELMHRLERDPELDPEYPAPYYQTVRNRFHKSLMS
jgi:8-oxo-dGTP pyrophosphatase MutT (NUDIX family)